MTRTTCITQSLGSIRSTGFPVRFLCGCTTPLAPPSDPRTHCAVRSQRIDAAEILQAQNAHLSTCTNEQQAINKSTRYIRNSTTHDDGCVCSPGDSRYTYSCHLLSQPHVSQAAAHAVTLRPVPLQPEPQPHSTLRLLTHSSSWKLWAIVEASSLSVPSAQQVPQLLSSPLVQPFRP